MSVGQAIAVGAATGLVLGILVSLTTDVPFALEGGLILGALVAWLLRRDRASPQLRRSRASGLHGLEELDRIPAGVLEQDLLPADPRHDLISKGRAMVSELLHDGGDIRNLELNSVPPSRLRQRSVRHRLAAAGSATRSR